MWRDGQFLYVAPPPEDILGPLLRSSPCSCRASSQGTLEVRRRGRPLYELETLGDEPVLACWAGLTPVVLAALQFGDLPVRVVGSLTYTNLSLVQDVNQFNANLFDRPFLEHVARHDRGLVRYDAAQVRPAVLVAQLAKLWPQLNVTLLASRREEAYFLVKQLREEGVDAFAFTGRNQPCVEKRVAVATYLGMANNPIEPEKQGIVIALNAVEATGKRPLQCLRYLQRARLYGLLDTRRKLSRHDEDLVHAVFGFPLIDVPRHGHRLRPAEVLWLRPQLRQLHHEPANDLELKRHGIWRHEGRNRLIARVARALVAGNIKQFKELFPSATDTSLLSRSSNVLVVVENVEHALSLLYKLPTWPVIASGLVNLDGLPDEQRNELEARLRPWDVTPPPGVIVTHQGLQSVRVPIKQADVLIRADGGTGMLPMPHAALLEEAVAELQKPLLIVDVADDHHSLLRGRAHGRRRAYLDAGWPLVGRDSSLLQLRRFMVRKLKGVRS